MITGPGAPPAARSAGGALRPLRGTHEHLSRPSHRDSDSSARATRRGGGPRNDTHARRGGADRPHFLDDNFVQPQPGTSAADHLVSGLVPLALLVLFALAYPRLRGGLRGTLAIVLGVFATVMGAGEAGYYALKVGPSADDYTGFLALAAGLLLIGIGATTLWRTRRQEGSAARRYLRRLLLAVVAFVGATSS